MPADLTLPVGTKVRLPMCGGVSGTIAGTANLPTKMESAQGQYVVRLAPEYMRRIVWTSHDDRTGQQSLFLSVVVAHPTEVEVVES